MSISTPMPSAEVEPSRTGERDTCRRCGDTTPAGCEDWDCHLGWGVDVIDEALEAQRNQAAHR